MYNVFEIANFLVEYVFAFLLGLPGPFVGSKLAFEMALELRKRDKQGLLFIIVETARADLPYVEYYGTLDKHGLKVYTGTVEAGTTHLRIADDGTFYIDNRPACWSRIDSGVLMLIALS